MRSDEERWLEEYGRTIRLFDELRELRDQGAETERMSMEMMRVFDDLLVMKIAMSRAFFSPKQRKFIELRYEKQLGHEEIVEKMKLCDKSASDKMRREVLKKMKTVIVIFGKKTH